MHSRCSHGRVEKSRTVLAVRVLVVGVALSLAIGWESPAAVARVPVAIPLAWPESNPPVRIEHVENFARDEDFGMRRRFWSRVVEVAVGRSDAAPSSLVGPLTPVVDAAGRLLVSDLGTPAVHVFDTVRKRHDMLRGPSSCRFASPIGIDSDDAGNRYVTDSSNGRIYVFDREGRFTRFIGERGNEGYFRRPTGLAIDRANRRIYLTDTLSHSVYVVSTSGRIERSWGRRGIGPGDFNYPTAIALADDKVFVLDTLNFRVQTFTLDGEWLGSFGRPVNEPGGLLRPKGLAVDAVNRLVLVVDAMFSVVQAFTYEGRLVWAFGHEGSGPGEFNLPTGIAIDRDGRLLVADTHNRRIQVFRIERAGSSRGAP